MKKLAWIVSLWMAGGAMGDIVHLKNGDQLEGEIKKNGDAWIVTGKDGKATSVAVDQVEMIEVKGRKKNEVQVGSERLTTLRKSTENLTDAAQVIERYRKFIEQNPNTPAVEEARKDMVVWQDRLDRGMVKVGGKWFTGEEFSGLREKTTLAADQARQLMKMGRVKEAEPIIQKVLGEDPQNAAAIYLQGLVYFKQDKLAQAKKSFDGVNGLVPDHWPTLNNLGVVLWGQGYYPGSVTCFEQAMAASEVNREILDNVAEALNGLPVNQRNSAGTKRLIKRFEEQDARLRAKMAEGGYFRWGSSWVTQAQLTELKGIEKEVRAKLDELSGQFDGLQARVGVIDANIRNNERAMRQMENSMVYQDKNGNIIQLPPPPQYYELQRENNKLEAERREAVSSMERMRSNAKTIQQQMPLPPFTGKLRVIETEGTPVLMVAGGGALGPSTRP